MPKQLCTCGNHRENHEPCENCSRFKMVFLLKDPKSNFKISGKQGLANPAFWSYLKEDKRPLAIVVKNMHMRAKKMKQYPASRYIAFYERSGALIDKILIA